MRRTYPRDRTSLQVPRADAEDRRHGFPYPIPARDVRVTRRVDPHHACVVRCFCVWGVSIRSACEGWRVTRTRVDVQGQPLLHLGHAPWAEYHPVLPGRHVAHDVPARAPFGAECASAFHVVGFVCAQDDGEVVVATCVCLVEDLAVGSCAGVGFCFASRVFAFCWGFLPLLYFWYEREGGPYRC